MKEEHVRFKSGDLTLEGLLARPQAAPRAARAAVVCHPHPLYGGSMYNNVVEAILDALWELKCATMRFNFRGVGASEGGFDGGEGEASDAAAAVRFLAAQAGVRRDDAILAGYSFGAIAAMRAGSQLKEVGTIVAVSLPLGMAGASSFAAAGKSVVLAAGDSDPYCPVPVLSALHSRLGASAVIKLIAGADHFFGGYEQALAGALASALSAVQPAVA